MTGMRWAYSRPNIFWTFALFCHKWTLLSRRPKIWRTWLSFMRAGLPGWDALLLCAAPVVQQSPGESNLSGITENQHPATVCGGKQTLNPPSHTFGGNHTHPTMSIWDNATLRGLLVPLYIQRVGPGRAGAKQGSKALSKFTLKYTILTHLHRSPCITHEHLLKLMGSLMVVLISVFLIAVVIVSGCTVGTNEGSTGFSRARSPHLECLHFKSLPSVLHF